MNFTENITLGKMYEPRRSTDRIFRDPDARFLYDGVYDGIVKFVQSHQVKNTALWVSFVEQFKLQVDSEDHGWSGEFYGKMMRGACWVYKYTQDEELYGTLEGTVRYLLECAEEDGRISSYKRDGEFLGWDMWCIRRADYLRGNVLAQRARRRRTLDKKSLAKGLFRGKSRPNDQA